MRQTMTKKNKPATSTTGRDAFWRHKTFDEMTPDEWESLCDGCARCCLHKLQDEDTREVEFTRVVCRLLDEETCRCTDYQNRSTRVPDCVRLTPDNVSTFDWLPGTCAYRRLDEGRDLAWWHPLVSGNPDTVLRAGISVRGRVLSEEYVSPDGLEEHVIRWIRR
jgi:uncharacterized cysteine cluster protein YcgN (CxxCxxCC family)